MDFYKYDKLSMSIENLDPLVTWRTCPLVWTRPPFPLVDSYCVDNSEIKDTFWKLHKKDNVSGVLVEQYLRKLSFFV